MSDRTQYVLTIVPVKGVAPEIVRLRHVLKALLRHHGFRCVDVNEVTATPPAPPAPGHTHAWLGWRRLPGQQWLAVAHGATEQEVSARLADGGVQVCVLPAGRHPDERQQVADGAGGIGTGH